MEMMARFYILAAAVLACFSFLTLGDMNWGADGQLFTESSSQLNTASQSSADNRYVHGDYFHGVGNLPAQWLNHPSNHNMYRNSNPRPRKLSKAERLKVLVMKWISNLYWSHVASLLGSLLIIRSYVYQRLPYFFNICRMLWSWVIDTECIDEFKDGMWNRRFYDADIYFNSRDSLTFSEPKGTPSFGDRLGSLLLLFTTPIQSLQDTSLEFKSVAWVLKSKKIGSQEIRYYELTFMSYYGQSFQRRYLKQIKKEAERLRKTSSVRKLYTNRSDIDGAMWSSPTLIFPPSFENLALDPKVSRSIIADLSRFSNRKYYYAQMGKPWKRKFLISGPPRSGKTSVVGAMSNFLSFDIFDLDLTAVRSKVQLEKLLRLMNPKSILVMEDVDSNGEQSAVTITLSDVLDIVDRLWISSFHKRLVVVTANDPKRADPAVLQPGKMDRQINLGYCRVLELHLLAEKYISAEKDHELMIEAEDLLCKVNVTPVEVVKMFMNCDSKEAPAPDDGMRKLVKELRHRQCLK